MSTAVRIQPLRKEAAPPEIRRLLEAIQDTMGLPWPPANWRSYAMYPAVMRLFWDALRPVAETETFLQAARAIVARAEAEAARWYMPSACADLKDADAIHRELTALNFGNPQILLQQALIERALASGSAGRDCLSEPRQEQSPYRTPELQMVDEAGASPQVRRIYEDIRQTLGLPLVNSDYQALAKWPDVLEALWRDAKSCLALDEYRAAVGAIARQARDDAERLCPTMRIAPDALEQALPDARELENLRAMIPVFTGLLPGLILNVECFKRGVSLGCQRSAQSPSTRRG